VRVRREKGKGREGGKRVGREGGRREGKEEEGKGPHPPYKNPGSAIGVRDRQTL